MKKKVLFVCTHNSARSQMAEGLLNSLYGKQYEAYSAGTESTSVNPIAIKTMAEIGIDISMHPSQNVDEFKDIRFDYVVTVCDNAKESCPAFSGAVNNIHKSFYDPSSSKSSEDEMLSAFKTIRDEIRDWISGFFGQSGLKS
ncbi:MAG: arsenate reductase ArsC [Candidatus Anammoxibacter sp.]